MKIDKITGIMPNHIAYQIAYDINSRPSVNNQCWDELDEPMRLDELAAILGDYYFKFVYFF